MNDEPKKLPVSLNEEFEIIELDDRLDMTMDPLTVLSGVDDTTDPEPVKPTNNNCGNIFCC